MEKTFFARIEAKNKKYGHVNVCPFQYVHSGKYIPNMSNMLSWAVVLQAFYSSTWEREACRSLGLDPTQSCLQSELREGKDTQRNQASPKQNKKANILKYYSHCKEYF